MPALGADMEHGTLLQWLVKPGDAVKRGDIVAVVDTSKAEIEVEVFEDGVVDELLVEEGTRVPVGTALAIVRGEGEPGGEAVPGAGAPATPVHEPPPAPSAAAATPAEAPPTPAAQARQRVTPLARRTAERLGVDIHGIAGSGPEGTVTRGDVERAAAAVTAGPAAAPEAPEAAREAAPEAPGAAREAAPEAPASADARHQAAMRQAIGSLMARSKREIPHYYLQREIDMSCAISWLAEQNLARPAESRILSAALLLSAVARAAAQTPAMNGFWRDGGFQASGRVHLGVAISLRGSGLIAPALHDADRMSVDQVMDGLRDLVARARDGRLRSSEMSDPTITVTNLGEQGADLVHGVIYAPQVALVGFGGIRERPWAAGGMLAARATVVATLAADHRASDGDAGSRFLTLIDRLLQTPEHSP